MEKKKKTIKGMFINAVEGNYKYTEISDNLFAYYELLGCHEIDIVKRYLAGSNIPVLIVCDDNRWFNDNPIPSATSPQGDVLLVGNLFIVKDYNDERELIGISEIEAKYIEKAMRMAELEDGKNTPILLCHESSFNSDFIKQNFAP